jgi:hypothetical protein
VQRCDAGVATSTIATKACLPGERALDAPSVLGPDVGFQNAFGDMLDSAPASVRVSSRLSAAVGSPARSRRLSPLTPTVADSSAGNAAASSQPLSAVAPPSPIAADATATAAAAAAAPTPPRSPSNLAAQQTVPSSFWAAVFRKSDAEAAEPESRFSVSERVADWVSENIGSWTFILILLAFLIAWFVLNLVLEPVQQWDPFPFILVNLLLSFIAAYAIVSCLILHIVFSQSEQYLRRGAPRFCVPNSTLAGTRRPSS